MLERVNASRGSKVNNEVLGKYSATTQPRKNGEKPIPLFPGNHWFPSNLLEIMKWISEVVPVKRKNTEFKFALSKESAEENWRILEKYNLSLERALNAQSDSQLSYGSEFKDPELLEMIFSHRPLWTRMKEILSNGANFPLENLSKEDRKIDLLEGLEYGNHKGVSENIDLFKKMMEEDVVHGFSLVIPWEKVHRLENALVAPMNIVDQFSINERGEIIQKKRLTHNQSFEFGSGTSVNSRVKKDDLQDVMYGSCLSRVIHHILLLRQKHPNKRILLQKIDYKSAHRRAHLNFETAIQTITSFMELGLAFISLRLTFGGAPNPNIWSVISESITDLANAILQLDNWDPMTFHSPMQQQVPSIENNTRKEDFAEALPLAVDIPLDSFAKADVYIDDTTTVVVEEEDNCLKAAAAVLLAIYIVGRAVIEEEQIRRNSLVSISKLIAEARLEETKLLLGWLLDTRILTVSLPFDKFKAWTESMENMISKKESSHNQLETLIGRLGHTTTINVFAKHFMSRLRSEMERSKNRKKITLKEEALEDLCFHCEFLKLAYSGISMNQISYRKPTHIYRLDACPAGLRGYSCKGRAWRWEIPISLRFRATLNMLEHVAATIGPWIDIIEGNFDNFSCVLSMTDSTTSAGWLRKSNFKESDTEHTSITKAKLTISRNHALRLMKAKSRDYSQWFPGEDNDAADSLSRDFHLPPKFLSFLLHKNFPSQMPRNFKLSPLPQEIDSFLYSMLQNLPESSQTHEKHKTSRIGLGFVGIGSSKMLSWEKTLSSIDSLPNKEQFLSRHSAKLSEKEHFQEELMIPWSARQSKPPWTAFLRPSESLTDSTQDSTRKETLANFYNCSSKAIKRQIQNRSNKKRSRSE